MALARRRRKLDWEGHKYVDDGFLALDCNLQVVAREFHVEVAALVFSIDGNGDIEVFDGLGPLVGQGSLLGVLSGLCLCVELLLLVRGGLRHGDACVFRGML